MGGLAGEFTSGRDGGGFDAAQDLSVGGFVGGPLELSGQQEGLFEDEGFQRGVRFKGTAHANRLGKETLTIAAQLQNYQELFLHPRTPCAMLALASRASGTGGPL